MNDQAPVPLRSYFTLKALEAGYLKPADLDFRTRAELRAAVLREMEKEEIRERIIAAEIGRRRAEEEDLWRRSYHSYPDNSSSSEAGITRYEAALRYRMGQERFGPF